MSSDYSFVWSHPAGQNLHSRRAGQDTTGGRLLKTVAYFATAKQSTIRNHFKYILVQHLYLVLLCLFVKGKIQKRPFTNLPLQVILTLFATMCLKSSRSARTLSPSRLLGALWKCLISPPHSTTSSGLYQPFMWLFYGTKFHPVNLRRRQ